MNAADIDLLAELLAAYQKREIEIASIPGLEDPRLYEQLGDALVQQVPDIIPALRERAALLEEVSSWRATAEELADKNVNKALTARHEMREAALEKEIAGLRSALVRVRDFAEKEGTCKRSETARIVRATAANALN